MEAGEFVALLGPNGAGKTTFLRILSTLCFHLGEVDCRLLVARPGFCGAPPPGCGFSPPLLYGDLTAEENLRFCVCMYSIPDVDRRIGEVLDLVGLAPAGDLVRTFSRMQQRLAIGRAVHDPEVMLFDEPHTGLDQDASAMLDGVLREVAARAAAWLS